MSEAKPSGSPRNHPVFGRVHQTTGIKVPVAYRTPKMVEIFEALYDKAVDKEGMTDLYNRRAFDEEIKYLVERRKAKVRRNDKEYLPVTVAFFDLNNFKEINTEHTQAGGDRALMHLARVLKHAVKGKGEKLARLEEKEKAVRLGGDEFAIIMHDTSEEQALKRCEKILKFLGNNPCTYHKKPITLETAYGVHELTSKDTPETVIHDASQKMRIHKTEMKNVPPSALADNGKPVVGDFTAREAERHENARDEQHFPGDYY